VELQRLAAESIGMKDIILLRSLVLQQSQLVKELRLLRAYVEQLESEITTIIQQAREGQILTSMGTGAIQAATIIADIGHINNFSKASELKK